jgi:predicted lipoprotein
MGMGLMMKFKTMIAVSALILMALSGCKIVRTGSEASDGKIPPGEAGDAARISALLARTYDQELLPLIKAKAVEPGALRFAIAADLDAAGAAHGYRAISDGVAWNFAISGTGVVQADNPQARARRLSMDVDGDGTTDLALQLGPVVTGTALRDIAPFYRFGDFRDQIEFARLGRALNDRALAGLSRPPGSLAGAKLRFTGVTALSAAGDDILVLPVTLEVEP